MRIDSQIITELTLKSMEIKADLPEGYSLDYSISSYKLLPNIAVIYDREPIKELEIELGIGEYPDTDKIVKWARKVVKEHKEKG